ncbi:MAG: efflux RND transporter permease subunit [Acidobacteriota bacterium]|nr:efflux RND transporter permease subunit [Acidobacteriota bacterium]
MKRIYGFFVRRPLLVNLMMVFLIISGLISTQLVTYDTFPAMDLGLVTVTSFRNGAGPEDMELSVTVPLEEELLKVNGLDKLTSNSMESMSFIMCRLHPDTPNPDQVRADIQKAVDRAVSKLPEDMPAKPLVETISSARVPILEIHLVGNVPEEVLRTGARRLEKGLREVKGVAGVQKVGYRKREVLIEVDLDRMRKLGISFGEISRAIATRNLRDTGGSLETVTTEKKILTVGKFDYPKQVEEVIVRSAGVGNHIRLRDIADVMLDYEDWQVYNRTDGRNSIALTVRKKEAADGLDTTAGVKKFLEQERPALPPGVDAILVNDFSRFTKDILGMLGNNAIAGFILVILVLLAFFQFRLAFWVAFGLPLALCLTLCFMVMVGIGIDFMTLTGFLLVLGMLVDDAIVTAESIYRHKESGLPAQEACIEGTAAIAKPVIVSTMTTVLSFAPAAFLGGYEGKFLWALPVVALLALGSSLLECQFMLPAHLAGGHGKIKAKQWFNKVQLGFDKLIVKAVRHRYITAGVFVGSAVGIVILSATVLQFNLYPEQDIDTFFIKVELPEGAPLEHTVHKTRELETMVRELTPAEDLLNINTLVGHHDSDLYGVTEGRNPAWAMSVIYLAPEGKRKTSTLDIIEKLRRQAAQLTGYRQIIIQPADDAPVQGKPVQVEVIGNSENRFELADRMTAWLQGHEGVTEVWTSYKQGKDIVALDLDYPALAARGLTVADVIEAVRFSFDGMVVNELRTVEENIEFRLKLPENQRGRLETLQSLSLINNRGSAVPLKAVADFRMRPGEANIKHYLGDRTVTVYAEIDRAEISAGVINQQLKDYVAEQGWLLDYGDVRLFFGGELEQQEEALGNVKIAFLLCVTAIFFLLVILFNSISQPFLVMIVVPFGFAGGLLAFALHGIELSMLALIGFLGLTGVMVNDSLVLISHLNNRKKDGAMLSVEQIAIGAGERLRPIVITTVTTVAGLFPAAYGLGGTNKFMTPMIMALLWGVAAASFVTLFLLPSLFAVEQDIRKLFKKS